ncbi:MAG: class II glutamine amidotransferase [Deltaproteobacteria bacterium]|nr:class II glutamine amidotransferase [Deltaproteobacteria bacterium]
MCELLGMECNVPTDIVFSFTGLRRRGGGTAHHADGWGLALYEGKRARTFLDPEPAAKSPLAAFVAANPIKTLLAIGHIRKKTRGPTSLANTHPFTRELWGRDWVFAHNGTVRGARSLALGRYVPIGTTDSEHAFCHLLEGLRASFPKGAPDAATLSEAVAELGGTIGKKGTFNFLLGDGQRLYARCATKLCHIIRRAPFGQARLADEDVTIDFAPVTTTRDRVAVVSTVPLTTNETWQIGEPNTMWVFDRGRLAQTHAS